jgi:hypothetical protein
MQKLALPTGKTISLADDQDGEEAMQAVMEYAEEEVTRLAGSEDAGGEEDGVYAFADELRAADLSGSSEGSSETAETGDSDPYGFAG